MKFDVPSNVMTNLFNQGYEEQIVDIALACNMLLTFLSSKANSISKGDFQHEEKRRERP